MKSMKVMKVISNLLLILLVLGLQGCGTVLGFLFISESYPISIHVESSYPEIRGKVYLIPYDEYSITYSSGQSLPSDPGSLPLKFYAGKTDKTNTITVKEQSYILLVYYDTEIEILRQFTPFEQVDTYEF